jgi:hypothetical protein
MEGRRTDAWIARDRCLQALVECEDVETRFALWRAALRYNERCGLAGTGGEIDPGPRPRARLGVDRDDGACARIEA